MTVTKLIELFFFRSTSHPCAIEILDENLLHLFCDMRNLPALRRRGGGNPAIGGWKRQLYLPTHQFRAICSHSQPKAGDSLDFVLITCYVTRACNVCFVYYSFGSNRLIGISIEIDLLHFIQLGTISGYYYNSQPE